MQDIRYSVYKKSERTQNLPLSSFRPQYVTGDTNNVDSKRLNNSTNIDFIGKDAGSKRYLVTDSSASSSSGSSFSGSSAFRSSSTSSSTSSSGMTDQKCARLSSCTRYSIRWV